MTRIRRLKTEAAEAAKFRGHQMSNFRTLEHLTRGGRNVITAEAECTVCGKVVVVDTHPQPNGIDIGGEAVALDCLSSVHR